MKRVTGSGIKSWELTEELWERVKELVPNENGRKTRPTGEGPMRGSIQWKVLPKTYGAVGSIHGSGTLFCFNRTDKK